ncbi:MAG: SNF2-related protein [Verrucomicrobiaceae bacterium]|nr:SNF2-related protein [Verrucomicrobiaceae bacterium]
MDTPAAGQRWVSDTEPELGLGVVLKTGFGRLEIYFPAANEHRQYALQAAPLRRVRFQVGDSIKTHDNLQHTVSAITEKDGLVIYQTDDGEVHEAQLSDTISFSKPQDRLFAGQVDDPRTYELRLRALERRCALRRSPARGFQGGRVDLIPHQMAIASEVTGRLLPRVLLADEVGLGKTIEACLILHRLQLTGRASRVLILVPDALLHQWFVEFFRRFNLLFSLFDEDRCESIENNDEGVNPFLDSQLVLTSLSLLTASETRAAQVLEAGWDLLIVDEAHHLEWHPDQPSAEYQIVDQLASKIEGLLLLSATPQQLGADGHFARLRLLDPDRYSDLPHFVEETAHYEEVAQAIDRVMTTGKLSPADKKLFAKKSERVQRHFDALKSGDESARDTLVSDLIDEFGTGRVMFRNTRRVLTGFPERKLHLAPLDKKLLSSEDPLRPLAIWLTSLLRDLGETEKVLAICHSAEMASQIRERVQQEINVHCELFHEGLTLLQRDRHAASFADPEGVRLLICSEIGSEGRNFQFAHHLVLLDLPSNVELLEQRIGRLDRIGQTSTIHIHVPHLPGTRTEALALWYHQGLNAFEATVHGAAEIQAAFASEVAAIANGFAKKDLTALVKKTATAHEKLQSRLARGQDRLLELSSRPSLKVHELLDHLRAADKDRDFETFFIEVLDFFGLHVEELSDRDYFLHRGELITDAFPALPEEGLAVTFDRTRALSREQLAFLTPDHPLVRGALDLLLGSEQGNSTFAIWRGTEADGLLVECVYVAECAAPAALHVDRFLPATPIRVIVNHAFKNVTDKTELHDAPLVRGRPERLLDQPSIKNKIVPKMLRRAEEIASKRAKELAEAATTAMATQLLDELARLRDLRQFNDTIREEEVTHLEAHQQALKDALATPQLRLDALRLIWCRPASAKE